jgi:hypothetical protein
VIKFLAIKFPEINLPRDQNARDQIARGQVAAISLPRPNYRTRNRSIRQSIILTSTGLCWNLNLQECLSVTTLLLNSSMDGPPYERLFLDLVIAFDSSGTFQPLICDNLKSSTLTSSGNSGIQTVNLANPV